MNRSGAAQSLRRASSARFASLCVQLLLSLMIAAAAPPVSVAAASTPSVAGAAMAPALELGSRGAAVRALQRKLAQLAYLPASAINGVFGMRTRHAVVAFQGWSGLARDGVAARRTQLALARARAPAPWSAAEGIEVHIAQQVLLLVRAGRVQRAIHVSTGMPGWPTPVGHFRVLQRAARSWSVPFQVWMPLAQYFYGGYAIHEFSEVPDFPASHGCVRVPAAEAQAVWRFARVGMRVWTAR